MAKYSEKAQKAIAAKMHKMKGEDRPQAQKVAISMSEARSKGLKVPKPHNPGKYELNDFLHHKQVSKSVPR